MRLIHNKNVYALGLDQYTWNEVPNSHQVEDKADELKKAGVWQKVRDRYLEKKEMYLSRQYHDHPSFVVYVEAVNEASISADNGIFSFDINVAPQATKPSFGCATMGA